MASTRDVVAIVGVGLIGGSIGMALRQRKLADRVIGVGRNAERLRLAVDLGAVTETTTSLGDGVKDADLVVVCAPVETIPDLVQRIAPDCRAEAVITDVGSTKQLLVSEVETRMSGGQATFVGSHPLAGSEKTGVTHATADLYMNRTVVVTPTESTPAAAVTKVQQFWRALGATIVTMSTEEHDRALAITSHLPHLIASALAASTPIDYQTLVATGWRDTTRIAGADPELWQQILLQNRTNVLRGLEQFAKLLASFEQGLQQNDAAAIENLLVTGKQRHDALAD